MVIPMEYVSDFLSVHLTSLAKSLDPKSTGSCRKATTLGMRGPKG